jgi:amino acid adenylation domain-containing protein
MQRLLQDCVTRSAERSPDSIAVASSEEELTYSQLDRVTNQLGRLLRDAGCKRGDRVAFLVPKSGTAIACILGILKADCLHVPLDTLSPASRLAKIIRSCNPRCLLAAGPVEHLLEKLAQQGTISDILVGWLGSGSSRSESLRPRFSFADVRSYPSGHLDHQNESEDPAYILFTSGSTGVPKGVVITHSNVLHFVEWANRYFGISDSDRLSGHSPLHFDLSEFDLFGAFAAGAQLHLIPSGASLLPNELLNLIRRSELTQWFSVPSVLHYVTKLDTLNFHDLPALKRVLWCGETLATSALIYWMHRLPHVRFTNLYGPTEATIASSYYTVPECPKDERANIPIGTACAGEELLILDRDLNPVPSGETGDLYISGVGLSPGYWQDPEKTASVFLPKPHTADRSDRIYRTGDLARLGDDGLVYFLGRADTQIKSRGYRIELGEIESALSTIPFLRESAVVAIPTDGFEGMTICCAYVAADTAVAAAGLRRELAQLVPAYMLPSRWLALEQLPRNGNGKVDRPKLREHFRTIAMAA